MPDELVVSEQRDGAAVLTLNRTAKRNALSRELYEALTAAVDRAVADDTIAAIVLTGGSEVFSAGVDLTAQDGLDADGALDGFSAASGHCYETLLRCPKVTIAACAGPTLGGGLDLALFCDIRLADRSAVFGLPQVRFGLTPFFASLERAVGPGRAPLFALTGERMDAEEAHAAGLVDRLVERDVTGAATALAGRIAELGTHAGTVKEMATLSPTMHPLTALRYEMTAYRDVSQRPGTRARVAAARRRITARPTEPEGRP